MPWPFGETGSGKIGLRPPMPHELRAIARPANPRIVISARARPRGSVTRWKYIGGGVCDPASSRAARLVGRIESETTVAVAKNPRYVDVSNPSLSVECPNCGLRTSRFIDHCRNCGYKLWPSSELASEAFQAWRDADPSRAEASRYDTDLPA